MATTSATTCATTTVNVSLSKELTPLKLKPVGLLGQCRRLLIGRNLSDLVDWKVLLREPSYELADDQTILTLKMAIIQDPEVWAGHLKPTSLRVSQLKEDTGEWDPETIFYRDSFFGVEIELADRLTIAECKRGDSKLRVHVGIRPSGLELFYEKVRLYGSTRWWFYPLYWMVLTTAVAFQVFHLGSLIQKWWARQ